jgi:hypothetical protein
MLQHSNSYVEGPGGFDIYGNVSGPSLYLVGNLASNNRYSLHPGPGSEIYQHPGFPYDFGQRPTPQYYYPPPPNMLISPQIPQHLPVSPSIPGSSRYPGNFDQQVSHADHGLLIAFSDPTLNVIVEHYSRTACQRQPSKQCR